MKSGQLSIINYQLSIINVSRNLIDRANQSPLRVYPIFIPVTRFIGVTLHTDEPGFFPLLNKPDMCNPALFGEVDPKDISRFRTTDCQLWTPDFGYRVLNLSDRSTPPDYPVWWKQIGRPPASGSFALNFGLLATMVLFALWRKTSRSPIRPLRPWVTTLFLDFAIFLKI